MTKTQNLPCHQPVCDYDDNHVFIFDFMKFDRLTLRLYSIHPMFDELIFPVDSKKLLEGLNEAQRKAVLTTEGPVLVIAGAGSGKTRVLTHRIAYLIGVKGVPPYRILAATFTNKAAEQMKARIEKLLGGRKPEGLWMGTFHSICVRILRRYIDLLGYDRNFTIYDRTDQRAVLKSLMGKEWSETPRSMVTKLSRFKNGRYEPDEIEAELFSKYEEALKSSNALDFDDLLLKTIELFEKYPHVADYYSERFQYIHVDEYQDTNRSQYIILKHLARVHNNIFVVGDEDQAIYGFRGADINNILDFEKDFPNAVVIRLEQNYRSTKTILHAASTLVSHNLLRKGKTLWTENPQGKKIPIIRCRDEEEEANRVVEIISRSGRPHSHFVVLYRTNSQSRAVEQALQVRGIPYALVGGIKFYERKEVKDVLAYLKLIVNPGDEVALKRIINVPARGIGIRTVKFIEEFARNNSIPMLQAIHLAVENKILRSITLNRLENFIRTIERFRELSSSMNAYELSKTVVDELDYFEHLRKISNNPAEVETRIENIVELLGSIKNFVEENEDSSLEAYLSAVSLKTDIDEWDENSGKVSLMTVHTAKGLEFPVVIIIGVADTVFPHFRSMASQEQLEEERRLLHVAITRAKEEVYITFPEYMHIRQHPLNPSPFLYELPEDAVVWIGEEGGGDEETDMNERSISEDARIRAFRPGDIVYHQFFGRGEILRIDNGKAIVRFASGLKTLVLKYAHLSKI